MQIASDELTGARQIKRWIRFNYFVAEICIERGRTHLKTKSFFFFCLQSKHEVFEIEMLCPFYRIPSNIRVEIRFWLDCQTTQNSIAVESRV